MYQYYFLKCKNCGYLTKIENENHNWCINCTVRFPNYFKKWKLENSGGTLDDYKKVNCEKYSESDIKNIVNPSNRKKEIINPTNEQVRRRAYIKEGIPLDRGGHMEWDINQILKFYVPIIIIIGILVLIVILLE